TRAPRGDRTGFAGRSRKHAPPKAASTRNSPSNLRLRGEALRRAFTLTGFGNVGTGFVVVDVVLGALVGLGEVVEVAQVVGENTDAADAFHPRREHLAGAALVRV